MENKEATEVPIELIKADDVPIQYVDGIYSAILGRFGQLLLYVDAPQIELSKETSNLELRYMKREILMDIRMTPETLLDVADALQSMAQNYLKSNQVVINNEDANK